MKIIGPTHTQLSLFASLFRGRNDVFARRWERSDKSGYAPAYDFDYEAYNRFRVLGGNFKEFPGKQYTRLTAASYAEHLSGKSTIGIYPLLEDNSTWFLALDFDEKEWKTEIQDFYKQCQFQKLPAYIERSRSGNGGHVWMFFEEPYPSFKSRMIALHLLQQAGLLIKSASSSFDRIFPNQDYLSGKGLGNLIALPLQGNALRHGNTAFLHPESFEVIQDQWQFLENTERIAAGNLDQIWQSVNGITKQITSAPSANESKPGFNVTLSNQVVVSRSGLPNEAVSFLRESLKIKNPNYFIRKATGQSTVGVQSSVTTLQEDVDQLSFPRGFIGSFLRFCRQRKWEYAFDEQRKKLPETASTPIGELRAYQRPALEAVSRKDFGVIVLPPGSGKTIIGLSIIAEKRQPALIIVHRRQLFDQWMERIQSFLGIPRRKIGCIKNGQVTIGEQITVAMIQSLHKPENSVRVENSFGLILVDECHHVPSPMYRDVLQHLHTWYLYGLTATPIRKDKDEQLIFHLLGELVYELPSRDYLPAAKDLIIHIRDTDLQVPFNANTDDPETISQVLIHDSERNALIADDVRQEVDRSRTVIILTERVAHLQTLNQYLKHEFETVMLSDEDSEDSRRTKFRIISESRFQVLITTGQFLGEGIDIDALDCLFLVYPCAFEGKLVQYIGRVQRGDTSPVLYDYRDLHIPYFEKMFRQRNTYYNGLRKAGLVGVHEEYLLRFEEDRFYFANAINALPISVLQLGMDVERFAPGAAWKIRILKYDEKSHSAFAEILDYDASRYEQNIQLALSYLSVEQIRFRTIDTAGLLKSVVLRKVIAPPASTVEEWHLFEKTIKVAFRKIRFENGCITAPYYFAALKKEINIEISNPVIRSEFQAVGDYFRKVLKLNSISVALQIKYSKRSWKIISCEATSEEISAIDADMIESVRFEFVKNKLIRYRPEEGGQVVKTFEQLQKSDPNIEHLIEDEHALLSQLLKVESARHFLHLRHLASLHEATVLKLRFVLQPFSFLFLASGERQYHIIWETLDTEEATYLWHIEKSKPALRAAMADIEAALTEMKISGRQEYLKKNVTNFSRIVHDYADAKRGFIVWRGMLEERLV